MKQNRKPGRPQGSRIKVSNSYVPLSVRIPLYLRNRLDQVSLKKKQTRSESVMEAINDYLFKNQPLWEQRKISD